MLKVTLRLLTGIRDDYRASYQDVVVNADANAAAARAIADFHLSPEARALGNRLKQLVVVRMESVPDPPAPSVPLNTDILQIAEHYVYNDHKAEQATL